MNVFDDVLITQPSTGAFCVMSPLEAYAKSFQAMADSGRKAAKGLQGMRSALRRVMRSMNPRKARGLRIHARRVKAAKRRG